MALNRFASAAAVALVALGAPAGSRATAGTLVTVPAQSAVDTAAMGFDGVVEAVRQTVMAAQVPGAVVQLAVKAGDRVAAGQPLLRLDARAAEQNAVANDAQVQAARASLDVAAKDFERQKQLFQKDYISQAALERAEAEFKARQAQVNAQLAQAGAARTQSGLHVVRAPFAGIVAEVPVSLGDMAMPGRPLLTLYDPAAMRITAAVPHTVVAQSATGQLPRVELPGLRDPRVTGQRLTPTRVQVLPAVDASTHTAQVRADLPAGLAGAAPGMFARLWWPVSSPGGGAMVSVPQAAVVRRAELTGLYVLDPSGKPVLRQVRLGRTTGDRVEILSGLAAGESVVADPQAAARVH